MCRVLLVDDDENVAMTLAGLITLNNPHPYDVEVAHSLKEAEAKIAEFQPEIVLLDLFLGPEDGRDLLRHAEDVPAICVITGHDLTDEEEADLYDRGAKWVLRKPITRVKVQSFLYRVSASLMLDNVRRETRAQLQITTTQLTQRIESMKVSARTLQQKIELSRATRLAHAG